MRRCALSAAIFLTVLATTGVIGAPTVAWAKPDTVRGYKVRVFDNVHHDVSPPLKELPDSGTPGTAHPALRGPSSNGRPVRARDTGRAGGLTPSPTANFDGVGANGSAPPDTQGAAGSLNQYFQMVNTRIAVYSKTGTTLYGPVNTNTLWSGFGGGCQTNNDGDGLVLWDTMSSRWVISQFSVSTTPFLMCVAVSTTTDALGTYNRYSFSYTNFPDYPKMGVWPDAYYVSLNLFNASGTQALGTMLCAYDRTKMLTGASATQQCFQPYTSGTRTFLVGSLDGATQPPAGSNEYFVGLADAANNLASFKFHVDWVTPTSSTLTGPTNLAVTVFSKACGGGTCIPQQGTTTKLDSLGDRVMTRLAYRNLGTSESLVVTHSVTAGSSVGARWYELRVTGGNLTVYQQGTFAPDAAYRWMGSTAMDQSGDIALGYSISSSTTKPGIRYTARVPTDPLGTMQTEVTAFTGLGSQTGGLTRWGDYSAMSVDPADDCTFWYTTEYIPANGSFNWKTRIVSFKYTTCGGPPPTNDFSISANPTSIAVTQGGSGTSTISTTITQGQSQSVTLSASGLPTGASASFVPNPITSGSSSTLTISTSPTTPVGTSTVTVTGTGTNATHSTTITLTVNPAGGGSGIQNGGFETGTFSGWTTTGSASISTTSPHSGTYSALIGSTAPTNGDSTAAQTFTAPTGHNTLAFWYKVVCPDTITYDWATVTLKDNTTGITTTPLAKTCTNTGLWKQVTTSVTAGDNYTITLISHDDNYAGDATYTYYDDVATSASVNVVQNGGFETGTFSPWTTGGALLPVVQSGGAHSGAYTAKMGSSSPYNGDSFFQQTVTVPAAGGTLTFWYQPHCTDTITYDWVRMEIRSTGGATLATVLNVCSNSGLWTQVTYGMASFANQTVVLWFNNHDDNYPSDPTYTLVDDVSLQ